MLFEKPHWIHFNNIGELATGYISVAGAQDLPFEVRRIFWTYYTPESVVRGRHAHYNTEMIIIAVSGRIVLHTELSTGERDTFVLEKPDQGVYLPPLCWHTMLYSHAAVQVVLASTPYVKEDYIRDYDLFKTINP